MKKSFIVVIIIAVLCVVFGVSSYNGLVNMNENINGRWSQVENQLQRRSDLIPNLVNTVKGYASQEKEVFQSIADARSNLAGAKTVAEKATANNEVTSALSRLLMIVENYPVLKSNENFQALQDELAGTENRLAVARKDYNDSVQIYNAKIKNFPTNIFSSVFNFNQRDYFEVSEESKEVPNVQF